MVILPNGVVYNIENDPSHPLLLLFRDENKDIGTNI